MLLSEKQQAEPVRRQQKKKNQRSRQTAEEEQQRQAVEAARHRFVKEKNRLRVKTSAKLALRESA